MNKFCIFYLFKEAVELKKIDDVVRIFASERFLSWNPVYGIFHF